VTAGQTNTESEPVGRQPMVSRVRSALRRARGYFPLTILGFVVLGLSIGALRIYAYDERDLVAFLLAGATIVVVAIALVLSIAGAIAVARSHRKGSIGRALATITTDEVESGFSLPSLRILPLLSVSYRIDAPLELERRVVPDSGRLLERLRFGSRGRYATISRTLSVGDVFGLCRIDFARTEERDSIVTPHFGRLDRMPTLRSLAHGDDRPHPLGSPDGDRLDVRNYAPGDPARFIHWKAFARTGKVVVRVPERAIATSDRVVAYQVSGRSDDPSAAAALAAITYGALGNDWTFGADGNPNPIRDVDSARLAVAASSAHRDDGARDLDVFLRTVEREGPVSLILFVPPTEGPWLDRVVALPRSGFPVRIVIGIDSLHDDRPSRGLERILRYDIPLVGTSRVELDRVRARLASVSGAEVLVVERPTGRVVAHGARASLAMQGAAA